MARPTRTHAELVDSPIAKQVERLQDIWIEGWTIDGAYCLIVDNRPSLAHDGGHVTVASFASCNSLGRWECSLDHFREAMPYYLSRFPRAHTPGACVPCEQAAATAEEQA